MKIWEVVGTERVSYDKADGTHVEAVNYHLQSDLMPDEGKGKAVDKIYVSAAAMGRLTYVPSVGDTVIPLRSAKGYLDDFMPYHVSAKS